AHQVGGHALVRGWRDLSDIGRSETARTDEVQDKVRRRGASLLPLRDAAALTASGRPAGPLGRRWEEARRSGGRDRVKSGYSSCQWKANQTQGASEAFSRSFCITGSSTARTPKINGVSNAASKPLCHCGCVGSATDSKIAC